MKKKKKKKTECRNGNKRVVHDTVSTSSMATRCHAVGDVEMAATTDRRRYVVVVVTLSSCQEGQHVAQSLLTKRFSVCRNCRSLYPANTSE